MPQNKAELLALLRRSQLLSEEQLRFAEGVDSNDPKKIIRQLFKQDWLTRWQCLTLLEGRCQFHLGKYRLVDLLGTGGMGAVFKAVHEVMRNTVAIKVLKAKLAEKETGIPRFLREIRVAANLDSRHIVRASDADRDGDRYYLVMEYVEGKDLKTVLSEGKSLEIPWLCECMRQAALGLQHAFERGTVHRDIKPANLIVASELGGVPLLKILDFGLAKFDKEADGNPLTAVGQAVGTPDYIAPEQARSSSKADIRADIYSLGCTFFELFTGQLPFPFGSVNDKLLARVRNDPPRIRSLRPDFPPELDEILFTAMRRNPDERYQSPTELAAALAPFTLTRGLAIDYGQSAPNIPLPAEFNELPVEETADLPKVSPHPAVPPVPLFPAPAPVTRPTAAAAASVADTGPGPAPSRPAADPTERPQRTMLDRYEENLRQESASGSTERPSAGRGPGSWPKWIWAVAGGVTLALLGLAWWVLTRR